MCVRNKEEWTAARPEGQAAELFHKWALPIIILRARIGIPRSTDDKG